MHIYFILIFLVLSLSNESITFGSTYGESACMQLYIHPSQNSGVRFNEKTEKLELQNLERVTFKRHYTEIRSEKSGNIKFLIKRDSALIKKILQEVVSLSLNDIEKSSNTFNIIMNKALEKLDSEFSKFKKIKNGNLKENGDSIVLAEIFYDKDGKVSETAISIKKNSQDYFQLEIKEKSKFDDESYISKIKNFETLFRSEDIILLPNLKQISVPGIFFENSDKNLNELERFSIEVVEGSNNHSQYAQNIVENEFNKIAKLPYIELFKTRIDNHVGRKPPFEKLNKQLSTRVFLEMQKDSVNIKSFEDLIDSIEKTEGNNWNWIGQNRKQKEELIKVVKSVFENLEAFKSEAQQMIVSLPVLDKVSHKRFALEIEFKVSYQVDQNGKISLLFTRENGGLNSVKINIKPDLNEPGQIPNQSELDYFTEALKSEIDRVFNAFKNSF